MSEESNIKIKKVTGEIVTFSLDKLRKSLKHSGANEVEIEKVIHHVLQNLYDQITSTEIYKMSFDKLRGLRSIYASRYKLKKSIYELGPSGFPFERLVATILEKEGFHTQISVVMKGECVEHEIDILAYKNQKYFPIECKFHSDDKYICNIKIPLYIHSRYIDLKKNWKADNPIGKVWIVTNTRFSEDAIKYAKCNNMKLLSWNYPPKNGLKDRISRLGLYPLTSLNTLSNEEKDRLLNNDIVLCSELAENNYLINKIGISKTRKQKILDEIKELCHGKMITKSKD